MRACPVASAIIIGAKSLVEVVIIKGRHREGLRRMAPASVPGIAFLLGGQSGELASARLRYDGSALPHTARRNRVVAVRPAHWPDRSSLTAHGEAEACQLVPWLRHIQFARVLTSPLRRARRTCELAGLGAAAVVEPDLAEWNYGDYEGLLFRDIRKERPGWDVFRDGCPNGEMSDRADRLMRPGVGTVGIGTIGATACSRPPANWTC